MSLIHPVDERDVVPAVRRALDAGPPIAPLPRHDADATLTMVRPDHPAEVDDLAAVVATSGSTGTPKGVLLTREAIVAAATATHQRLGGPGDWTLALPAHYVAGLMVIARTVVADTDVHHAAPDLHDLPDHTTKPCRPQYLSLVPTQLVRALTRPAIVERLAHYDAILVGGTSTDDAVLVEARRNGLRIVTTYGMSETCGGCVYDSLPLDGVRVQPGTDDRLMINGPMLFSGYRLRPDLTAAVMTDDGRFRTGDRGTVDTSGRVTIAGRIDDVVVSGGINVDLAAVERTAREVAARRHARSVEVAVVGVPDDEWGTRVVAVSEAPLTREDLGAELAGALLPRQVEVLPSLPRTSGGKVDRRALADQIAVGDGRATS